MRNDQQHPWTISPRPRRISYNTPPPMKAATNSETINVLDMSTSMNGYDGQAYETVVSQVKALKELESDRTIYSVIVFNANGICVPIYRTPVFQIRNLDLVSRHCNPGGNTPLYDAIDLALGMIEHGRASIVDVFTDGHENASNIGASQLRLNVAAAEMQGVQVIYSSFEGVNKQQAYDIGISENKIKTFNADQYGTARSATTRSMTDYIKTGATGQLSH